MTTAWLAIAMFAVAGPSLAQRECWDAATAECDTPELACSDAAIDALDCAVAAAIRSPVCSTVDSNSYIRLLASQEESCDVPDRDRRADKYKIEDVTDVEEEDLIGETQPSDNPAVDSPACFPAQALVEMASGGSKPMSLLKVGDLVQTPQGPSAVFFFSHRKPPSSLNPFVQFTLATNLTVTASASHFLMSDSGRLRPAADFEVGERFTSASNEAAAPIVGVAKRVMLPGLYNPHTLTGSMFVDGIQVSCYTAAVPPVLSNLSLSPFRWAYRRFGASFRFLDSGVPNHLLAILRRIPGLKFS